MNVTELKAQAKELGLKGYSKLKKAELQELVDKASRDRAPLVVGPDASGSMTQCQVSQLFNEAAGLAINPLVMAMDPNQKRKARNKAKAARRKLRKQGAQAGF